MAFVHKRRWVMKGLNWHKNLTEALNEVSGGSRLPMILFHRTGCEGSVKMLNETLKDLSVERLLGREIAPVLCNLDENPEMGRKFHIDWTPAFVITDEQGTELERFVGYLPVEEFIPQLLLSKGLADFHIERLKDAMGDFEELIEEHAASELVPEAEYYLGAVQFRTTGDISKLGDVCAAMNSRFPDSIWTKKCSIWGHQKTYLKPFVGYDGGGSAGSGAY